MFYITVDDVLKVYEQLKDRYDLLQTTTSELDEGFTVDCPIIVGKAHGQIIELYEKFLGEPNSHKAHELLHTTYAAREGFNEIKK